MHRAVSKFNLIIKTPTYGKTRSWFLNLQSVNKITRKYAPRNELPLYSPQTQSTVLTINKFPRLVFLTEILTREQWKESPLLDLSSLNRLSGANNLYAASLSLPFKYRGIFLERSSVNVFLLKSDLFQCKGIYEQLKRSQCKEKVRGVAEWSILKENFESAAKQYRDNYEKYKKLQRPRRQRRRRRGPTSRTQWVGYLYEV